MHIKQARKLQVGDVVRFPPCEDCPHGWGRVTLQFKRTLTDGKGNKYKFVYVERKSTAYGAVRRTTELF